MDERDDDPDRAAILARRRRWIAMAVAGVASTTLGACQACLSPVTDAGPPHDAATDPNTDAGPDAP